MSKQDKNAIALPVVIFVIVLALFLGGLIMHMIDNKTTQQKMKLEYLRGGVNAAACLANGESDANCMLDHIDDGYVVRLKR